MTMEQYITADQLDCIMLDLEREYWEAAQRIEAAKRQAIEAAKDQPNILATTEASTVS